MHVVFAAAVIIAFVTGFAPQADIDKSRVDLYSGSHPALRMRHEVTPHEELAFKHITAQEHDYSCGSAALGTLLNYSLGENLSEKQVIHGMMKHGDKEQIRKRQAFSLLDMKRLCGVLGYEAAGYKAELEDIKNPEHWPCIIPIKVFGYRHFVVLKGVHDNRVFLADPFTGNTSYTLNKFKDAWYENVIFMVSEATQVPAGKNLLALTRDDLRYISEDITWDMIKNPPETFEMPVRFERREIKGEYQIYRP
ncbi:MAG: C39 family peptidase [Desulfobacteraceae bacterium]|nr:C39 family peptidase [Desulfobacteraceae bacterium]